MNITDFFQKKLGVRLNNTRWSWGAMDVGTNQVFLRIWENEIQPDGDGQKVQVFWKHYEAKTGGSSERARHIEAIKNGARGIGVIATAFEPNAVPRKIKSFDEHTLLELGEFSEDDNAIYAQLSWSPKRLTMTIVLC